MLEIWELNVERNNNNISYIKKRYKKDHVEIVDT